MSIISSNIRKTILSSSEIFQLSDIPSIKEYTEKKPKTKDKAYKLWDQWDVFQRMIDKTALD